MSFDWEKLEHEQRERDTQLTLRLGATWLVLGLVALVVDLATGHPEKILDHSLFWVVLGGATVAIALGLRRPKAPGPMST